MKYFTLKRLAINILLRSKKSIPKVRFAKVIYFVFKYAVSHDDNKFDDLEFVRMPLGPVPVGFMDLSRDSEFGVEEKTTGLMYNRQSYYLADDSNHLIQNYSFDMDKLVEQIGNFHTSELVELSHKDISWKTHSNGQEYFITKEDVKTLLPKKNRISLSSEVDDQLVQARLVAGMENDAVEDSTFLEYPEHKNVK